MVDVTLKRKKVYSKKAAAPKTAARPAPAPAATWEAAPVYPGAAGVELEAPGLAATLL